MSVMLMQAALSIEFNSNGLGQGDLFYFLFQFFLHLAGSGLPSMHNSHSLQTTIEVFFLQRKQKERRPRANFATFQLSLVASEEMHESYKLVWKISEN